MVSFSACDYGYLLALDWNRIILVVISGDLITVNVRYELLYEQHIPVNLYEYEQQNTVKFLKVGKKKK